MNNKKWAPLNGIICLIKSTYLKSVKFSKICIEFLLIWYVVSLCRPNISIKFVGLNEEVYFLCLPLLENDCIVNFDWLKSVIPWKGRAG